MKALLEQPNGLARRLVSKAGGNPSELLEQTDAYIRQQPKVSGDAGQVRTAIHLRMMYVYQHLTRFSALRLRICPGLADAAKCFPEHLRICPGLADAAKCLP